MKTMIQATELRIGNYLTYHTPDDTDMPCKIDAQDILNISTNYMHNAEIHSPIPLTEEILLKCGFEKVDLDEYEGNNAYFYSLKLFDLKYCNLSFLSSEGFTECSLFPYDNIRFKHLHELQNAFKLFTGNELNITL